MERGGIFHADLNPVQGREQTGSRYVLIVSARAFNVLGTPLVCPITQGGNFARHAGFAISLSGAGTQTQGVVLCINRGCSISRPARRALLRRRRTSSWMKCLPSFQLSSNNTRSRRQKADYSHLRSCLTMVFTKEELIASLKHEVRILTHLAGKVDQSQWAPPRLRAGMRRTSSSTGTQRSVWSLPRGTWSAQSRSPRCRRESVGRLRSSPMRIPAPRSRSRALENRRRFGAGSADAGRRLVTVASGSSNRDEGNLRGGSVLPGCYIRRCQPSR